jgi:hypothetical protein
MPMSGTANSVVSFRQARKPVLMFDGRALGAIEGSAVSSFGGSVWTRAAMLLYMSNARAKELARHHCICKKG